MKLILNQCSLQSNLIKVFSKKETPTDFLAKTREFFFKMFEYLPGQDITSKMEITHLNSEIKYEIYSVAADCHYDDLVGILTTQYSDDSTHDALKEW